MCESTTEGSQCELLFERVIWRSIGDVENEIANLVANSGEREATVYLYFVCCAVIPHVAPPG